MPSLYLLYGPLLDFNETWGVFSLFFLLRIDLALRAETLIHTAAAKEDDKIEKI